MKISIIIPTLNEEASLPETLSALASLREVSEIIVVDAQSEDDTIKLARLSGARVISTERKHRAHQLNCGAREAQGDILWFLHADTWVPREATEAIREAFAKDAIVGGGFKRRFRSASPFLLASGFLANLRSRFCGLYFGDQSLVVRRSTFEEIGGFADFPVFEDFDLCKRLKKRGRMAYLTPSVRSSARRFEKRGPLLVTVNDLWLTFLYHRGESPYRIWKERIKRR